MEVVITEEQKDMSKSTAKEIRDENEVQTCEEEGKVPTIATETRNNERNEEEINSEKLSIMRNIIFLSIAYTFLFSSYFSMENLQSSINKIDGTASLAAIYTSFIFSSCFISTMLLRTLKEKLTCLICAVCYTTYMAAQLFPNVYILVPTAVILGMAAGPLWAAQGTYITKAGTRYAYYTGEDASAVITRFFSIFFMFFQSTQIWGNLISSTVLSVGVEKMDPAVDEDLQFSCGYGFCISGSEGNQEISDSNTTSLHTNQPPMWKIQALTCFYLSGAVLSFIIIALAVKPMVNTQNDTKENHGTRPSILQMLSATFNHMRHPYQMLLVPLTIWSGVERAFIGADFTAAFVSCDVGVHMVGYTMICYGACDVLSSTSTSFLVKVLGRPFIITIGFLINISLIIAMILWVPSPDQLAGFFVLAGLWGVADGIWMTQINSLYSVLFPKNLEAAFSNCRLWEATGFALSFALSSTMCINAKIIVLLVFLGLGVIGYYFIVFVEKMGGLPREADGRELPLDRLIKRAS